MTSQNDPRLERLLALLTALSRELHPSRSIAGEWGLDAHLERDFGLDSLARVELFARIEREFGLCLGAEAFAAETVGELFRLIAQATPLSPSAAVPPAPTLEAFAPAPETLATLPGILDWHLAHQPERIHLFLLDEAGGVMPVSYARLALDARRFAAGLLNEGIETGSRIALMLPTGLDFFIAFHGTLVAGCVPVPLYPPTRPTQLAEHLSRIAGILANAGAVGFVTDTRIRPFADALLTRLPQLRRIATVAETMAREPIAHPVPRHAHDLAFLQYTSGSTGDPKGVVLTHANLLANIHAMRRAARVTAEDVFVSWLPLYHDMGLIGAALGSFVVGFPLVLMSPLSFLAQPARWLTSIAAYRGTLSAAPNFAYEICTSKIRDEALSGLDLSSWRLAFNGAEPVLPATLEHFATRFSAYGFRREALTPVYGLAECSVGLTFPPPGRGPRIDRVDRRLLLDAGIAQPSLAPPPASQEIVGCGHPLPDHEVRIVDSAGRSLAERQVGRIQFRGPSASSGYFANPEATAALLDGDWRNTGDLGYLADGELFVTGRIKDLIIRGGHNIHPQELEAAIGALAGIRTGNVAVFPALDPATGSEKMVVLAETRLQDTDSRSRLRAEIERLTLDLTGIAADDVILAPPGTVLKTSSGKIRRAACRAAYERGELGRRPLPAWRQTLALARSSLRGHLRRALFSAKEIAWGLWAWTVYLGLAPLFWILIVLLPPRWARRCARLGARLLLAVTGLSPRVEGLLHLETALAQGPVVLVANHASYLDGLVLSAVLPPCFAFVAKQELLAHPLSGPPLKRLGAVFVERFDAMKSAEDSRLAEEQLRAGEALVFFPEGTFVETPGLLPFRLGAFAAAARAHAPILPVAILGTRRLLPGERRWPRPSRLSVVIAPPIRPLGDDWTAILALRDAARAAILTHLSEPDAGY